MSKMLGSVPVLDRIALEKLTGYKSGDRTLIAALASAFTLSVELSMHEIRMAAEKKDFEKLAQGAHRLKSASSTLGLARVSLICSKMEKLRPGAEPVSELLEDLEIEIVAAQKEIEKQT